MKKMSQKQKNRNNLIAAKRFSHAQKRKPHVKKIMASMNRIKLAHRRMEKAQRRLIRNALAAKSQGTVL